MTKEQLKKRLVDLVMHHRPLASTTLPTLLSREELAIFTPDMMDELVEQKKIVEVEYTLPVTPHRIKSLYFPIGSAFNVKNGKGW